MPVSKKNKSLKKIKNIKVILKKKFKNFNLSLRNNSKTKKLTLSISFLIVLAALYINRGLFLVAFVNGVPITKRQYTHELEKMAGQQVFESILTKILINQEAKNKKVSVTDQDISSEIDNIVNALKTQGTTLENVLGMQNQTIEELKENIKLQKTVELLLADKVNVNDSEMQDYFDKNKEQYGENADFESLKNEIHNQLKRQKLSVEFEPYLESLKNESNIIYIPGYNLQ